ncbi:outer membrane beta-barrel protein [Tenacibaculum sp. MAR_2009_124]|uniref:outer membrane beta-barrel protein n=1 Tax=Tenacibaculum sp. MAR_2009_124 TaxID=1250059 RepID=UPI0015A1B787|nr:outer membrane beta-barrel protein [Tenacibaculum sp. MAR_2009_124]
MKTKFTLLLLLFVTAITVGQNEKQKFNIKKGTWMLEGDFSINSVTNEVTDSPNPNNLERFSFSISPKLGYAISNNLVLGLSLGYGYSENEYNGYYNSDDSSNTYSIAPYIKKFFPVTSKFALHLQGETSFSYTEANNYDQFGNMTYGNDRRSYGVSLRPGINYSLSKNVLLEMNFGALRYNHSSEKNDENATKYVNRDFGFNLSSSSLIFGVSVLL